MKPGYVTHTTLVEFISRLDASFARPGRLYLIGETTQVFERWRSWTSQIEFTADVAHEDRATFAGAVGELGRETGLVVLDESPAALVPLPDGYETRARLADGELHHMELYHFDPYSVALRFLARGDEPDYHLVLMYLEHGWVTLDEMDSLLAGLLPRMTAETIQQDPAEFRRKYKGMLQMWNAGQPRTTHRSTMF